MFNKLKKIFAKDKRVFELQVPQDILVQTGYMNARLGLNDEVQQWCINNNVFVDKVYPNAGMSTANGTILFGPFYVRIYDDAQRMLFKLKWC